MLHDPLYSVLIQDICPSDAYPKADSVGQVLKWGWILRKGANSFCKWFLQWRWETSKSRFLHMPYVVGSVQLLSHVQLFATPWTVPCQASLFFTISWSLLKLTSIESMIPPNHLIQSPSSPALNRHQSLFQRVGSSHQVAKILELQFQHQSFQWIARINFL